MCFRQTFKLVTKNGINWYPGHMSKGMIQMQQKLKNIDCIIEVHDARLPVSGRNPQLQRDITGGLKPYILALNKKDLIEMREQRRNMESLRAEGIKNILFTNCKDQQCDGLKKLLPLACNLISQSDRYNRSPEKEYNLMIIGVPNVGKSSLLNWLRNRHLHKKSASKVGAIAGVTRSVLERIKINESPRVYMIDTPGVLEPRIKNDEMGMKLALIGCIPDHIVGEDLIADYLLYWLNIHNRFDYVQLLGVPQATDNIHSVLVCIATKINAMKKTKKFDGQIMIVPDIILAARYFIKLFRSGVFGKVNLESL